MKQYVYSFLGVFSFITMFLAPLLALFFIKKLVLAQLILSFVSALALSAIIVDIVIGATSIILGMKEVYIESVRKINDWILVMFIASLCQYLFFAVYYISAL